MIRPYCLIQHVPYEMPGLIASAALEHGIQLDVRHVYAGDRVPALHELDGLIVMGGPMGANEDRDHPSLPAERALLAAAARAGLPTLGVCLGAQLLAAALGARVSKGPAEEIGYGEVALTPDGERDPVLGPAGPVIPVFHWHGDTFELPSDSVHLAASGRYPSQAFRFGDRAYGFQFHIEVDLPLLAAWATHLPARAGMSPALQPAVERAGRGILARFFGLSAPS